MDSQEVEVLLNDIKAYFENVLKVPYKPEDVLARVNVELENHKNRCLNDKIPTQPNKLIALREYLKNGGKELGQKEESVEGRREDSSQKGTDSGEVLRDNEAEVLGEGRVKPLQRKQRSSKSPS